MLGQYDLRHLMRARQQVIGEGAGQQLALRVIVEMLVERGADTMRGATQYHALDDIGVDHGAAVMRDGIGRQPHQAGVRIDGGQHDMGGEGVAGIHLHPPVRRRQGAAQRHLPDIARLQPRLGARRHQVVVTMGDEGDLLPAQLLRGFVRIDDDAIAQRQPVRRGVELVGGDQQRPLADQPGRARGGAAQHDRHAAGYRGVARQARERVAMDDADILHGHV